MAKYTAADVKALRDKTGAGMMDAKNALVEADGDAVKAEEILRLKGLKVAAKRGDRTASNGLVLSHIGDCDAGKFGLIVEVNAETDFVAKNEKFIEFSEGILAAAVEAGAKTTEEVLAATHADGTVQDAVTNFTGIIGEKLGVGAVEYIEGENVSAYMHKTATDLPPQVAVLVATDAAGAEIAHDIAVHIAALSPQYLDEASVPEEVVENERRIATELTIAEGKPEKAVPKIVEGRLQGFFKQVTLMDQGYARDPKTPVSKVVKDAGAKVTGFKRVRVGQGA
ncbi:translation elongation factor Ts [Trueperella bialowiezensis]|uniref:Elongation factor Ts n=1 Tax=Trueperella bialowiezensis TaxID=312285 RepID=A0A448PCK5_9ACTO|nr:translation elongation factor Ts [Trueperella bialowiezensis]VEI12681.1 Elongation factor Ts [Trueperella bialowiezensis]